MWLDSCLIYTNAIIHELVNLCFFTLSIVANVMTVFAHLVLHQMTLVSGLTFSEVSMVFNQATASFATTPMIYVGCSDRPALC